MGVAGVRRAGPAQATGCSVLPTMMSSQGTTLPTAEMTSFLQQVPPLVAPVMKNLPSSPAALMERPKFAEKEVGTLLLLRKGHENSLTGHARFVAFAVCACAGNQRECHVLFRAARTTDKAA
mgnify:CR=1 FL=1